MPERNGLEAAREILRNLPQTKILILTIHDSDVLIPEMRQAGVHGYVRKHDSDRDLISAIQALVSNETFYPPASLTASSLRLPSFYGERALPASLNESGMIG